MSNKTEVKQNASVRDVSIIIRCTASERDNFKLVCESRGYTMSDLLRGFIKDFKAVEGQADLFKG